MSGDKTRLAIALGNDDSDAVAHDTAQQPGDQTQQDTADTPPEWEELQAIYEAQNRGDNADEDDDDDGDAIATMSEDSSDDIWDEAHADTALQPSPLRGVMQIFLGLVALAWSGFFGWSLLPVFTAQADAAPVLPSQLIDYVVQWSVPMILLIAIYLLMMRNSTVEARKFGRITQSLSQESSALQDRLSAVNGELSIAREFLANQKRELDSLGRISTERLLEYGEQLRDIIQESDEKMRVIGDVSATSVANIETLRIQLPVISQSAKDVTNQIGNVGNTAQVHVNDLQNAFTRLNACEKNAGSAMAIIVDHGDNVRQRIEAMINTIGDSVAANDDALTAQAMRIAELLEQQGQTVQRDLEAVSNRLNESSASATLAVSHAATAMTEQLDAIQATTAQTDQQFKEIIALAQNHVDAMDQRLSAFDDTGTERISRLAFAIAAAGDDLGRLSAQLEQEQDRTAGFAQVADALLARLKQCRNVVEDELQLAMANMQSQVVASKGQLDGLQHGANAIFKATDSFTDQMVVVGQSLAEHNKYLTDMAKQSNLIWAKSDANIIELTEDIRKAHSETADLVNLADTRLAESLRNVQQQARDTRDDVRSTLEQLVGDTAQSLSTESAAVMENVVRVKAAEIVGKLEAAINRAVEATGSATVNLRDQLVKVDELTVHLERRVRDARDRAQEDSDSGFARRFALLSESLNSTSIDIAKIMNKDVSDTSWAAYLKGDRGVFTRRAVRLLDTHEAKEIAQFYENDPLFYDQVNRFIHDFEAMLRNVMSTRDGGVMSVTLLSSDVGKLYVALAQSIARLRE